MNIGMLTAARTAAIGLVRDSVIVTVFPLVVIG
jgi:hypothetical protein